MDHHIKDEHTKVSQQGIPPYELISLRHQKWISKIQHIPDIAGGNILRSISNRRQNSEQEEKLLFRLWDYCKEDSWLLLKLL